MDMALDLMYEDCYVVTQYYGQNLTVDQGAPLVLVPCGMPGDVYKRQYMNCSMVPEPMVEVPMDVELT